MNQQAALELPPKAQVLEGRGIQGHFEIKSLGNEISQGFQEVFSTVNSKLFCQNTRKTENNTIKISQAFHDITRLRRFTDLKLFKYVFNDIQNWETYAL